MKQPDNISVVIRTFNSSKTLPQVLSGIHLGKTDELIIVDSGSTDDTLDIARSHQSQIILAGKPFNYSKSLNLGFRAARNPWVLVISSHCIPVVPDFVEAHRSAINQFPSDVVVAFGPATLTGESRLKESDGNPSYYSKQDHARVLFLVSGNMNGIYRKTAWEEALFDENIRTGEDQLWLKEMLGRNYRFAYTPKARVVYKNQGTLAYMFQKGFNECRAFRLPSHRPMNILQFVGALKGTAKLKLRGKIEWSVAARSFAHVFGQFLGSYFSQDNTPQK